MGEGGASQEEAGSGIVNHQRPKVKEEEWDRGVWDVMTQVG